MGGEDRPVGQRRAFQHQRTACDERMIADGDPPRGLLVRVEVGLMRLKEAAHTTDAPEGLIAMVPEQSR